MKFGLLSLTISNALTMLSADNLVKAFASINFSGCDSFLKYCQPPNNAYKQHNLITLL